ncbi:uncharacterized protein KGF55_002403 [Candida pseudojiufengensis]|uniref:uncharacterized protein n=1 Tax=Candida pseudojiufengensis TaxID=497109 RepID=UPI0022252135|nr:uncharacterized protein KGF55_002403 [Candida pseudojiufengensis]KAI5963523.1 hypothetical protein KGF55_002403 [Candida pseudojiufengensis]
MNKSTKSAISSLLCLSLASCSIDTIPIDSIDIEDISEINQNEKLYNQLKLYINLIIPQQFKQYQIIGFFILTLLQSQLFKTLSKIYKNRPREIDGIQESLKFEFFKNIFESFIWILFIVSILIYYNWFENLKPYWILFLYPVINIFLILAFLVVRFTN